MVAVNIEHLWRAQQALSMLWLLLILNICGVHSRPYHSYAKLHVVSSDTGGPAMVHVSGASTTQGGPDKLSSLRNNHMTILHSSLHKYILAVHDLHCIPRYISTYT